MGPASGGGRFAVRTTGRRVEKTGSATPLWREAQALRAVPGTGVPRLLRAWPGGIETTLLPGGPRAVGEISGDAWNALGELLYRVHHRATASQGQVPRGHDLTPAGPAAFVTQRLAGVHAAAQAAGCDRPVAPPPCAGPPFHRLHGDLTLGNVVWDGATPGLVDWEFSRFGDPAEDLAGLVAVNRLPRGARAAVKQGYGDEAVWRRVAAWEPVVTLEAAAWWRAAGRDDLAAPLLAD